MTEAVRRQPYCVILLDEIEKAHRDVFNVLLQVLDDGRLTDGHGALIASRTRSSSRPRTSVRRPCRADWHRRRIIDSRNRFSIGWAHRFLPEFLNRIDEIIVFEPLDRNDIRKIVDLQLTKLIAQMESTASSSRFPTQCERFWRTRASARSTERDLSVA
ncbi:MAG: AAA family ATPase [Planctomycetaceae bacterium]